MPRRSAVATSRASASRGRCSAASLDQLGGPPQVVGRGRHEADRPPDQRVEHGAGGLGAELALEQQVDLREREGPQQQRLVGALEPGDGRAVVEVRGIGGGEHRGGSSRIGHLRRSPVGARLATRDRAPVERQPAVAAPADAEERELGRRLVRVQPRLERGRDHRGLGRALAVHVAVEPVEQVGVEQDRGPERSSYDVISTTLDESAPRRAPSRPLPFAARRRPPMTRFEPNLRIPGPTALPPSVREAGGRQMVNHRGEEFKALLRRVEAGMKPYFGTEHEVILLTCAGTGALEAAVVNTLSPGDPVLGVTMGAFGDRFAKIAEVYGAAVTRLEVEWGEAAEPAAVREAAAAIPGLKAVLLTHNETSTGVTNDIGSLAAAVREVGPRGADPRGRHLGPRGGAVRDGRMGPRPRGHRLAEGLDGGTGHGDGGRRAAGMGRRRDGTDAALLPGPQAPPRHGRQWRDALDASGRGAVPGRRGPPPHAGRGRRRVRPPRRCPGDDARRPPGHGLRAPGRRRRGVEDRHRRLDPRRTRLEGLQRRPQASRPRARRRAGKAQGTDLPARPPRLGHHRRHPCRHRRPRGRGHRGWPAGRRRDRRRGGPAGAGRRAEAA